MKVLKFGGTSVGSVESILSLKNIVEHQSQDVIVVVSALGGITDKLIATSKLAVKGDEAYRPSTPVEGNLTVNKAKVSVKVHSTSIYADEAKDKLGEGFVTTDPADKFDIYTIYGGMTLKQASKAKVDAVSGATYSSRSVIANVKAAADYLIKNGK